MRDNSAAVCVCGWCVRVVGCGLPVRAVWVVESPLAASTQKNRPGSQTPPMRSVSQMNSAKNARPQHGRSW